MTIEQAKEILEKWKYRGSDGLTDERLGYIEGWYHKKDDVAFEMAIKSLDMWNNVLVDLENLSENMVDEVGGSKFTVDFIIKMIKEYREEVEK